MPTNYFISDWKKPLMLAIPTFDSRFLTDTSNPLVAASGRVTGLSGFPALEPPRIDIVSSAEERTKQPDLGVRRRVLIDESRFEKHIGWTIHAVGSQRVPWGSALLIR